MMMTRKLTMVARAIALCATLAVPAAATTPARALAQETHEVPLSVHGGRMVVPVQTEDGAELTFLVSTGSSVTVLSESGAARIGDQAVTMGAVPVKLERAVTIPDADLTVDGVVMDGLVSNNTLNEFDVLFDVPGGRLLLKPIGRSVDWPGVELSDPVPLRVLHGVVLTLDLEIDGTPYPAMLDLGSDALLANEAVLEENQITDGTADLTLGSLVLPGLPIEVTDNPIVARFSPNGDGFVIVGGPPALECAISISWVHRELRTCVR